MRHRPKLPAMYATQDLLGGPVENVVVVFDKVAANLLSAPDQRLQLVVGRCRGLLHNDVRAGIERVHGQPEVGGRWRGDVDYSRPGLLQHGLVIGEPCADAESLSSSLRRRR